MPATLSHLGVQTLFSKILYRDADLKWIALGCVIPDLPWIAQRLIPKILPGVDLYDLRLYCIIQASLIFCLILSAAVSLQVRERRKIFALLSLNCLLHLLLDAMQIKLANGVHLLAPFSWELLKFNLFWPEDSISYLLMGSGLVLFIFFGFRERNQEIRLIIDKKSMPIGMILLLIYLAAPMLFLQGPLKANNHFIATLSEPSTRTGKPIELDRCTYDSSTGKVTTFNHEPIDLNYTPLPKVSATISIKGFFSSPQTIKVETLHLHHPGYRDIGVLLGLLFILLLWLIAIVRKRVTIR
ncbi:MAG: hypothetical protein OEM02_03965 [Desulfobulbaceae bacterium]|nr:hypothetical protein [Desulfobulbaceae bacterium]